MSSNDDGLFGPRFDIAMLAGDFGWEGDRGFVKSKSVCTDRGSWYSSVSNSDSLLITS